MWASMFIQGLFFISFSLLITCLLVIIIIYDRKIDTNHEIWISSKLLTLKNVMNINNFNLYRYLVLIQMEQVKYIIRIMHLLYNIQEKNVKMIISNAEYLIHIEI